MYFIASTTFPLHGTVRCVFVCVPFMPLSLWESCIHLNCVLHNSHRLKSLHLWNSSSMNKRREKRLERKDGERGKVKWERGIERSQEGEKIDKMGKEKKLKIENGEQIRDRGQSCSYNLGLVMCKKESKFIVLLVQ